VQSQTELLEAEGKGEDEKLKAIQKILYETEVRLLCFFHEVPPFFMLEHGLIPCISLNRKDLKFRKMELRRSMKKKRSRTLPSGCIDTDISPFISYTYSSVIHFSNLSCRSIISLFFILHATIFLSP
jgi:hypothetical protein